MFETIFLNAVQAISESRFWFLPLIILCAFVILAVEVFGIIQEEIDEWWPTNDGRQRTDDG